MTKRLTAFTLALTLLTACSGDGNGGPNDTAGTATTEALVADGNPVAYCARLETMLGSQPDGTFFAPEEFTEAMNAYAEAVEAAAELAPPDQVTVLDDLAVFIRESATDPQADGLGERFFALVGAMLRVQNHAQNECGLDVETLTVGSGGTDDPPPPIRDDVSEVGEDALAGANALVPAGVNLAFESFLTTDDEEHPVLAAAPVGWEASDFFGTTFKAGPEFGFFTKMEVGAHCNGLCAPRDWRSLMTDVEIGPFSDLDDATEILHDVELSRPAGRLVAYRQDSTITPLKIVVARWDDRANRYFRCEARLDEEDVGLWEAFAAACEAAIPLWLPAE